MSVLTVTNTTLTPNPADSTEIDANFAKIVSWAAGGIAADNITAGSITQTELAAAGFDGTIAATTANANVLGGLPVVHRINIADGTGDTDVTLTHKTRVIDVWTQKTAGAAGATDTVQVKNSGTAITNAITLSTSDNGIVRATTIDDAQHEIAAGGTLRISAVKTTTSTVCTVYVLGLRVA